MAGGNQYEHYLVRRVQGAHAVDHGDIEQVPTLARHCADPLDAAFGHSRVVFEI